MELIEREALYTFLTDQLDKETGAYSKGRNAGIHVARSALHNKQITPTIEATPVRHGRWIECDDDIYTWIKCSECGFEQNIDDCGEHPHEVEDYILCPACGTRMDGGEGHEDN